MITSRVRIKLKDGKTATTIYSEDQEVTAELILSPALAAIINRRAPQEVQAIYIEVITK